MLVVRRKYDAEKQKLDTLIAAEVQQEKDLAAKKTKINAEIKRLQASMPKTTVKVNGCPTINGVLSSAARTAIQVACQQVGDPYVWGATGPNSFDCSGLTQFAYKAAGISLTHFTGAQWNEGKAIRAPRPAPATWSSSSATCTTSASTWATTRWCTRRGPVSRSRWPASTTCRLPASADRADQRRRQPPAPTGRGLRVPEPECAGPAGCGSITTVSTLVNRRSAPGPPHPGWRRPAPPSRLRASRGPRYAGVNPQPLR